MGEDLRRFEHLTFDDFRRMAQDDRLSPYEKVGFPNAYREGKEEAIFADIRAKLPTLEEHDRVVFDIGPGCSALPRALMELCREHRHRLVLLDSPEMLAQLPEASFVTKVGTRFPKCPEVLEEYRGRVDAIVIYSVLQYIYVESNWWAFVDAALSLLAPGGILLIGDIPNISKRKRFFASQAGVRFHRAFMETDAEPEVVFNRLELGQMDDAALMAVLAHARAAGFDAYLVPQAPTLPMANRREDIVIRRP